MFACCPLLLRLPSNILSNGNVLSLLVGATAISFSVLYVYFLSDIKFLLGSTRSTNVILHIEQHFWIVGLHSWTKEKKIESSQLKLMAVNRCGKGCHFAVRSIFLICDYFNRSINCTYEHEPAATSLMIIYCPPNGGLTRWHSNL